MSVFFQPYEGKRPYVFISYSHRNSEAVLEIITRLNNRLRLWYDEGIQAGSDWPMNIQTHMAHCGAVLFFLSATALASLNCLSEIQTAVSLGRPVLYLRLDDAEPDETWQALLSQCTEINAPKSVSARQQAVLNHPKLGRRFFRKWTDSIPWRVIGFVAALLLLGTAIAGMGLLLSGRFDPPAAPDPTPTVRPTPIITPTPAATPHPTPTVDPNVFPVSFPDTQQENAVRDRLNKYDGNVLRTELSSVTELYFCGNMYLNDLGVVSYTDGAFKVGKSKVIRGEVQNLSVIGMMGYLRRLALVYQPVTDLSPLNGLVLLEELDLSGDELTDLAALYNLPSLTVLHLDHSAVRNLRSLSALPSVQTVTVTADMLPLTVPAEHSYDLILIP
ncbi:MAG: TIR domain-containing protein [Clostridia bacterium]|nr:TIR domain-containing protein [Clostridia bacterium]